MDHGRMARDSGNNDRDRGFVLLHRKAITSAVFSDATLWRVWTWCLMRANYRPARWRGLELPRGSFVTAVRTGAKELGMARSTFHRALSRLEKMQNIGTEVGRAAGHEVTIVTVLNYEIYNAPSAGRGTVGGQQVGQARDRRGTGAGQGNKNNNINKQSPPTPPGPNDPPAAPATGAPPADPWRGVEGELAACGIGRCRSIVADCQQARLTPEAVQALIKHWRKGRPAWGPGALVNRIALQTPDGPAPDVGWPDPAAEALAQRARQDADKRRKAWDARMDRERAAADQDRQRLADLEAEHGATVDAMPREELRELLQDLPALARKVTAEGPLDPLVRSMAVELVAAREPQPP